jgi:tellurite methyltransferase
VTRSTPTPRAELCATFGQIDIYLFDQLLKGRFDERRTVLDAGCGAGRNLRFFLQRGFSCFGIDRDAAAVEQVQALARQLAPQLPSENFLAGSLERLPWPDGAMNAVISSAVLHFAYDEPQFARMLEEAWRVIAPDGMLFARLASSIGLEDRLARARGRVRLPDGSDRFVVDEAALLDWTARLGAQLLDPIKTTNVQGQRAMTTWVLLKPSGG